MISWELSAQDIRNLKKRSKSADGDSNLARRRAAVSSNKKMQN